MSLTNWQDPGTREIRSTDISGLQEIVSKLERSVGLNTVSETDIPLTEVYISENDRWRIFQAPEGKRNWVADPAPIIKKDGVQIYDGFVIDYGAGAVILSTNDTEEHTYTADATYVLPLSTSFKSHLAEYAKQSNEYKLSEPTKWDLSREVIYDGTNGTFNLDANQSEGRTIELGNLDLSNVDYFDFLIYVSNVFDLSSLRVQLYSQAPAAGVGYYSRYLGGVDTRPLNSIIENGWRRIRVTKESFTLTADDYSPNWDSITHMRFTVVAYETIQKNIYKSTLDVIVKEIVAVQGDKATITFDFDDAYETQYTKAYPILDSYGFKGNININTSNIGASEYLSWEQVKELYDKEWAITSHGHRQIRYTDIPEAEIRKDIETSQALLRKHGLQPADLFHVANSGAWNPQVDMVAKEYFKVIRVQSTSNIQEFPPYHYRRERYWPADTKSVQENKDMIDATINAKGLLVLNFHSIGSKGYSESDFEEIVSYVKNKVDAGLARVLTKYEIYLENND